MSCCHDNENSENNNYNDIVDTMLFAGDKVPSFTGTLYSTEKKAIEEFSFQPGKWTVFYFYPADFTFVCPTELSDLEKCNKELKKMDVDLFGVSTDSAYAHLSWHQCEKLLEAITYPLIADTTKEISEMFNLVDYTTGFARRGIIIVNPSGIIDVVEVVPNNMGRSSDELLRKVQALIHIEKHGGICPANWTAGDESLDPSKLVVGDVYNSMKK